MDSIELRPVTIDDAGFLYRLLESRPENASISHKEMPPWDAHLAFVASNGQHPLFAPHKYDAWYIIGKELGAIYLTNMNEIGISLMPLWRRGGIGSAAIKELVRLNPRPFYLANIAPGNSASIKFFEAQGFRHIQNTYELRSA